eukprot:TRINITY_DN15754_c0_g1_i1.p1 TRINITY_DN15754_c0_g1~~TRINITY_DN15754_c0_g1_i1.p1  ORF type:complete len:257 (+),score=38.13 TRINITY_DN15754_c0_g1_i1:67-771(+)
MMAVGTPLPPRAPDSSLGTSRWLDGDSRPPDAKQGGLLNRQKMVLPRERDNDCCSNSVVSSCPWGGSALSEAFEEPRIVNVNLVFQVTEYGDFQRRKKPIRMTDQDTLLELYDTVMGGMGNPSLAPKAFVKKIEEGALAYIYAQSSFLDRDTGDWHTWEWRLGAPDARLCDLCQEALELCDIPIVEVLVRLEDDIPEDAEEDDVRLWLSVTTAKARQQQELAQEKVADASSGRR